MSLLINEGESRRTNEIGTELKDLLLFLEHESREDDEEHKGVTDPPFFLGQLSDRAGKLYERVRAAVDNKEEHFLRRYAIRRIAKRIMWFSDDPKVITGRLLRELYKSGYLPEDRVSRHVEEDVVRVVATFLELSEATLERAQPGEFIEYRSRLLDIIAGEIEDRLYPTYLEEGVVRLLARISSERTESVGFELSKDTLPVLHYVAAWKALFLADKELLIYKLWRYEFSEWQHQDDNSLALIAHGFPEFLARANLLVEHPFIARIQPKLRNLAIALTVLYELIKRYGRGIERLADDPHSLEREAEAVIREKYRSDILRSKKKAKNAVVYIFATKALLAALIESASIFLFKQPLTILPIAVNIVFHPALLLALTSRLSEPDARNTERVRSLLLAIVYGRDLPSITLLPRRLGIIGDIALACYVLLLISTFYGISVLLFGFGFHIVDIALFLLFLALVMYFAFRVRYGARRMECSGASHGFIATTLEVLAMPIVSVGRFLVTRFERLNFVALFLDFFVELPLKLVLEFFDTFSSVIKEKKDEIYS